MTDLLADNEDLVDAIAETMYQHVAIELRQVPEHWDNQTGTTQGAWRYEAKRLLTVVDEHQQARPLITAGREALAKALEQHAPHIGPVSGSWTCPAPCNAMSTNGSIEAGDLTSREERAAEWRAHLADALLVSGAVVPVDTLADDEEQIAAVTRAWYEREQPPFGPVSTWDDLSDHEQWRWRQSTSDNLHALVTVLTGRGQS